MSDVQTLVQYFRQLMCLKNTYKNLDFRHLLYLNCLFNLPSPNCKIRRQVGVVCREAQVVVLLSEIKVASELKNPARLRDDKHHCQLAILGVNFIKI